MTGEILETIEHSGINGIKKADLRKAFGNDCEDKLEILKEKEQIFIEKKGVAYYVWTRENYIHYITHNDSKFKLMLGMLAGVSHSLARVQAHNETLQEELARFTQSAPNQDEDFEGIFTNSLKESTTSIGWVSFDKIREKVCESQKLSKERFYQLATELIEKQGERYEVSTGGQEGIVMRGLVHGFVRNI